MTDGTKTTRTPRVKSAQEMAVDGLKKLTERREVLLDKAKATHAELLEITPQISEFVRQITGNLTMELLETNDTENGVKSEVQA